MLREGNFRAFDDMLGHKLGPKLSVKVLTEVSRYLHVGP